VQSSIGLDWCNQLSFMDSFRRRNAKKNNFFCNPKESIGKGAKKLLSNLTARNSHVSWLSKIAEKRLLMLLHVLLTVPSGARR
jgi:hypothetical protein